LNKIRVGNLVGIYRRMGREEIRERWFNRIGKKEKKIKIRVKTNEFQC